MLLKFWSFFIFSKKSSKDPGKETETGKNPVSDLQVPTSEIFVLKTVREPIRVHGGDPYLEVRVAATDIAQSIYKHLSIKSQRTPLNSFTKGAFSGFPILYSS